MARPTITVTRLMSDFIGVYPGALDENQCQAVIEDFTSLESQGFLTNHDNSNKQKINDSRLGYSDMLLSALRGNDREFLLSSIRESLMSYVTKYSEGIFGPTTDIRIAVEDVLVQRTRPTEGYHVWHCERQDIATSSRAFSWILYLNDVEEGGETEFLYYSKRIKPKAGTLIVFPAGYTHAHRGNPPLTDDKFIVTGWNRYHS